LHQEAHESRGRQGQCCSNTLNTLTIFNHCPQRCSPITLFEKQKALQENAAVTSQKKYHWQFVPVFSTSVPYLPRTVLLVIIHALSDPNRTPDLSNRIHKTLFRSDGHRSV
jgi:hypothetical protein